MVGRSDILAEKHVLILTTTYDFAGKFELENVKILRKRKRK
ncbi:hypothetical protein BRYFOR_08287 [Marvinbryantia formatexigens DSM 14469]|uniref:Uncharacterized protein n=1 Tax=Marvinbryantia formatexigens DSM 14469 TaxID=478749 RepID=C6LI16_9FIRM|nr:hypothetical protein BRYFOR_08287 [Marvinbryantia formatexigens DSM 14469]